MLKSYTSKFSYFSDEVVELKINSIYTLISVTVYKFNNLEVVYNDNVNKKFIQNCKINKLPFIEGYNWKTNYTIKLDKYISGLYFIELKNINNIMYYLPINIKNKKDKCKNIVLLNSNTWNAYNDCGGSSFYRYILPFKSKYGPIKEGTIYPNTSIGCTFDRPFDKLSENISFYIEHNKEIKEKYDHLLYGELRLLKFMELNNIKYDLLDDIDLHKNLVDISKYENFILNCHPEYWSIEMNSNVKINANNIISLAGNVCYRKVIYENNVIYGRVGYFSKKDLENITGSYFTSAGADTYSPYKILSRKNVLFRGIYNDTFGKYNYNNYKRNKEDGISGHETDKKIEFVDTQILASGMNIDKKKNKPGGGDILYFTIKKEKSSNIRKILSVGSIVFTGGLFIDKDTNTFCENIFNRYNFNKLFVFAFTKTGSTSMSLGLKKIGLNIEHITKVTKKYNENINNDVPILTNLEHLDGLVLGENNYKFINKIYKDYPNSKYIYLHREENDWLKSYKRHQLVAKRTLKSDEYYLEYKKNIVKIFIEYMKEKNENILIFNVVNGGKYNTITKFLGLNYDKGDNEEFVHAGNSLKNKLIIP